MIHVIRRRWEQLSLWLIGTFAVAFAMQYFFGNVAYEMFKLVIIILSFSFVLVLVQQGLDSRRELEVAHRELHEAFQQSMLTYKSLETLVLENQQARDHSLALLGERADRIAQELALKTEKNVLKVDQALSDISQKVDENTKMTTDARNASANAENAANNVNQKIADTNDRIAEVVTVLAQQQKAEPKAADPIQVEVMNVPLETTTKKK